MINPTKRSIKPLFRKIEGIWEGDLFDKHGKHRRRLFKANHTRIRRIFKKETEKEILENISI